MVEGVSKSMRASISIWEEDDGLEEWARGMQGTWVGRETDREK